MPNLFIKKLIDQGGLVKEKAIGWDQVKQYLKRAEKDLKTAKEIIDIDEAVTLELVYKSMFHTANALVRAHGLRPGKIRQHKAVIIASQILLGAVADEFILRFDKLRIKRNEFEYGAISRTSHTEIINGLKAASEFHYLVEKILKTKNPQTELL